ncbi:MAG: acetate--CoA ligase family protein, partial [Candidatus Methylomirabilota bacterium]
MGLTSSAVHRIDGILETARLEGRRTLFEHEVYAILEIVGLGVPRHRFVRDIGEVDREAVAGLGRSLVAKIVSPGIPHKHKVGGVTRIADTEPCDVRSVLTRMATEVRSHFPPGDPPAVAGFLLVEYVPHNQAIGYETLLGFREDSAFGPILAVSKGGEDAEFFAAHYDPANLFLPPVSDSEILAFLKTLHIRHRFEEIGHPEYLERIAQAMAGMSRLAEAYSSIGRGPRFIFSSFEVNPFVISEDDRFLALDGLAEFRAADAPDAWASGVNTANLDALFRPRGIAVAGVSSDPGKVSLGRDIAELLHDLGRDDLVCLNPKGGTVRLKGTRHPLVPSPADSPHPVDLLVYAAPAQHAPAFLRSLAGSGVRAVIFIPGIPSAIPYPEYAQALSGALPPGVRLVGPNCMGVYCAPGKDVGDRGVNTLFINEARLEVRSSARANAVLLTQSGALAVTALDKLRGSRPFLAIVSFGNKLDVDVPDLLEYFERDPAVGV